jgi:hypothetical protein
MRKFWMLAIAALAASLWLPAAAQAQRYSYPKTYYGNWKVYGLQQNCWLSHQDAVDGTILSFAVSNGRDDFYFGFENRSWTQFGNMKRADVTLRFGSTRRTLNGTQVIDPNLGPMMVVFVDPATDLFATVRGAGEVGAEFEGERLFGLPLDPGADAVDDFENCARKFKAGPFSGT